MCHHSFSAQGSFLRLAWEYSENREMLLIRADLLGAHTQHRLCVNTISQVCGQQRGFKERVFLASEPVMYSHSCFDGPHWNQDHAFYRGARAAFSGFSHWAEFYTITR